MPEFTCDYEFDEINVCGEGLMAWGTAELADDGDSGFYVKSIKLTNGTMLDRNGSGPMGSRWGKWVFERICEELYTLDQAAEFFAAQLNDSSAPCPDRAYEENRDRQMEAA